jgi:hypothetical protein
VRPKRLWLELIGLAVFAAPMLLSWFLEAEPLALLDDERYFVAMMVNTSGVEPFLEVAHARR